MMQKKHTIVFLSVLLVGCATVGYSDAIKEHIANHQISLNVGTSLIKKTAIKHRQDSDKIYLSLRGTVFKPYSSNANRLLVTASFMDAEGNVLVEETQKVRLIRGTHTRKRPKGNFIMKVVDNPEITNCKLAVERI